MFNHTSVNYICVYRLRKHFTILLLRLWRGFEKSLLKFVTSVHGCLRHSVCNVIYGRLSDYIAVIFQSSQYWRLRVCCEFKFSCCILEVYQVTGREIHIWKITLLIVAGVLLIGYLLGLTKLELLGRNRNKTIDRYLFTNNSG